MTNSKIELYKALRSVREKMEKGLIVVEDKKGNIDFKEFAFLISRVQGALVLADADPDFRDLKLRIDQSKPYLGMSPIEDGPA